MSTNKTVKFLSYSPSDKDLPLRFVHKAMNTIYEIWLRHDNEVYAEQAASAAFNEIDRLELELSRFNSNSDISRINALKQLEVITLGSDCYQCLQQCSVLYQQTKGVFDISAGFLIDLWKKMPVEQQNPDQKELQSMLRYTGMPWLCLFDNFQVQLMSEKISLDLGGYGKGYAIRVVTDLLQDWGITDGLINAGMSSMMPLSNTIWPIEIRHPQQQDKVLLRLQLSQKSISGSGIKKGQHIIDPRSGASVRDTLAAWAITDKPGISDALSTAFMIMPVAEIESYCHTYGVGALIITANDNVKYIAAS